MRKIALFLLLVLGFVSPLQGQVIDDTGARGAFVPPRSSTATLGALNAACTVAVTGRPGAGATITTTNLIATVLSEVSFDSAVTWLTGQMIAPPGTVEPGTFGGAAQTRAFGIVVPGGATHVRVRVSAYTSGSGTCIIRASEAAGLISSINILGTVTVTGNLSGTKTHNNAAPSALSNLGVLPAVANAAAPTFTEGNQVLLSTDLGGALRVTGGGGGTQYAEDSPHVSGDTATLAGVVQQAADAGLSTDGDRSLLQVDASGFLKVNVKAGSGSGVTHTDDAAFTPTTDDGVPAFGVFDGVAPDSVDEGDAGALRMTANRWLQTVVCDGASNERCANVNASNRLQVNSAAEKTDQTAWTAGTTSGMPLVGAFDDAASSTVAEDTVGISRITTNRALHTNLRNASGAELGTATDPLNVEGTVTVAGSETNNGAAPGTNDVGTLPAVATAAAPSYTEGRQVALSTNLAGTLRVDATIASGTGGHAMTDKEAWTEGTTRHNPIGAVFNDVDAVGDPTEDQTGMLRMSANRGLHVSLRNAAGTELASAASHPSGSETALITRDVRTSLTGSGPTFATVGVASAEVLAVNTSRKGAVFTNTSSNTISCALSATAVVNSGITLLPGGTWTMDEYTYTTAAVNCIASAASSNLAIQSFQ